MYSLQNPHPRDSTGWGVFEEVSILPTQHPHTPAKNFSLKMHFFSLLGLIFIFT